MNNAFRGINIHDNSTYHYRRLASRPQYVAPRSKALYVSSSTHHMQERHNNWKASQDQYRWVSNTAGSMMMMKAWWWTHKLFVCFMFKICNQNSLLLKSIPVFAIHVQTCYLLISNVVQVSFLINQLFKKKSILYGFRMFAIFTM